MKIISIIITTFFIFISFTSFSQIEVCEDVDEIAEFPGGEVAFKNFINSKIDYSSLSDIESEGTVYARFIVEKTGKISQIEILRGLDPSINTQAELIIGQLPNFEPAMKGKEPVNSWFYVPIKFLPESERGKQQEKSNEEEEESF